MCQRRIYKNTNTQIHKHTNTQIQHITKCQKDPPCGIFLKRGLFKDVKIRWVDGTLSFHLFFTRKTRLESASTTDTERFLELKSEFAILASMLLYRFSSSPCLMRPISTSLSILLSKPSLQSETLQSLQQHM